jgi:hypothetical protein
MAALAVPMRTDMCDSETNFQKSIKGPSKLISQNTILGTAQLFTIYNALVEISAVSTKSRVPQLYQKPRW